MFFFLFGGGYGGERITAPFFSFVKQRPSRTWFSDASLAAMGGICNEMGVYWRFDLGSGLREGRGLAKKCTKMISWQAER